MYHTNAHHYSLQICLPVVPCEHDQCAFNSDAHQRDYVNVPLGIQVAAIPVQINSTYGADASVVVQ